MTDSEALIRRLQAAEKAAWHAAKRAENPELHRHFEHMQMLREDYPDNREELFSYIKNLMDPPEPMGQA